MKCLCWPGFKFRASHFNFLDISKHFFSMGLFEVKIIIIFLFQTTHFFIETPATGKDVGFFFFNFFQNFQQMDGSDETNRKQPTVDQPSNDF